MGFALDLVGGAGLFLLGIMLFMESLRSITGDALRQALSRFTSRPWKAMLSGLAATSVIQSAHATAVMAMGLAGAGILSGTQAVAILIGSNIGTTSTAWLVALLGLRVGFGPVAIVLVALGAFIRLVSRSRWGTLGQTMAGFGLLFVGIDLLAAGMTGLDIGILGDGDGIAGVLLLIALGALTTAATQSSSVTVAATVTAVYAGALPLDDAAWLVIGQNLGTTSTLALVSLGASAPGRRLALAHVIINGSTAVLVAIAFVPILGLVSSATHGLGGDDALAVAGFHTAFNAIGAVIWLPLTRRLSGWLDHWIKDKGPRLASNLDALTASVPSVGVASARHAAAGIAAEGCNLVRHRLEGGPWHGAAQVRLDAMRRAMGRLRSFVAQISKQPQDAPTHRRHIHVVHAVERLTMLMEANVPDGWRADVFQAPRLASTADHFSRLLDEAKEWLRGDMVDPPLDVQARLDSLEQGRIGPRDDILEAAALGHVSLAEATAQLDAWAWMHQQATSIGRIVELLGEPGEEPDEAEAAPEST